jgi:hypothetical protein
VLIQIARPRLRPPGNAVLRVNRSHPLAAELRACIVTGGQFGLGRDLVTGAMFTGSNSPTISTYPDGAAADFSGTSYISATKYPEWNVTGALSLGWRGMLRSTANFGMFAGNIPTGGNGASNSPFDFGPNVSSGDASVRLVRSNASGFDPFRIWKTPNSVLTTNVPLSVSASQGASISDTPTFFVGGAAQTASLFFGSGSGASGSNSDPLFIGRRQDGATQQDGLTGLILIAATQWAEQQHIQFSLTPYGVLEEAPWYYFATPSASGPLTATIAGTVDITASVSAAMALDAQIAGTVPITASATAALDLAATIGATVPITASIQAQLSRIATITGEIPITASIQATNGGGGDTHDGYLRRSRRQRALEAAERRREAERLADAQALRLELQAAMGMAADVVAEAPAQAVEAVQEAVAVVQAQPAPAAVVDFTAARAAIADLLATIEAAQRAKALADDDEDVEILLRAL